jgi:hypothetical protein
MKSPFGKPFKGTSPFGPGAGNGLTIAGRSLSFLASAQPYTVTGADTISVADSSNAGGTYGIAISISSGTISLSGTTGLSFSVGDGTADAAMTFTGSLANINTALGSLVVASASSGTPSISITFSHAATSRTNNRNISMVVGVVVANSVAPVISGTNTPGSTLTTTDGTWTGTLAPTFTYQWYNEVSPISGETGASYVVSLSDVGSGITCKVTGTNVFNSVTADSNEINIGDGNLPVLSAFVDDLDETPPIATFTVSEDSTITWDFHSSATPPAKGAGNIGTGTFPASAGNDSYELTLPNGTGYLHLRGTDFDGDSNVITSQQITISGVSALYLLEDGSSNYLLENNTDQLLMESA